jgi:hypothetical protein
VPDDDRKSENRKPRAVALDPFGDSDGANGDIADLRRRFIRFQGSEGLATRSDDLNARVIVGRKGAGKTTYLRRARAHATQRADLYADDIQQNLPSTTEVVKVTMLYPASVVAERWTALWRVAILRSLASHLLNNRSLVARLDRDAEERLREHYRPLLRAAHESKVPLSIYSQLTEILVDHASRGGLDNYLANRLWAELEWDLAELIRDLPPVCFYIDAVDEEFRHAPGAWLMCQLGLFNQVMHFLRDQRLGGRLHVFICVRDHVFSSLFDSEHATRYLSRRHIRLLEWDDPAIRYFLHEKLQRLDNRYVVDPVREGAPGVANWLGLENIYNEKRAQVETTEDYLVRHTRLLPRDIVLLGNELSMEVLAAKQRGETLSEETVRKVVRAEARTMGKEQLSVCANHIASNLMPRSAAQRDFVELYTGSDPNFVGADAYQENLRAQLIQFVESIGRDRFDHKRFVEADEEARDLFNGSGDPMSVLWQNGLLGYGDQSLADGEAIFYSAIDRSSLEVRRDAPEYFFHPCLLDAVNLTSDGPGSPPVRPVRLS